MAIYYGKEKNHEVQVLGGWFALPHCGLRFRDVQNLSSLELLSVYQQSLVESGILSLGVNNFCFAHTRRDVENFIESVDIALDRVKKAISKNNAQEFVYGKMIQPVFKRR